MHRIYFNRFHQLLFGQTQATMLALLQRLPATPAPGYEYNPVYDTLKAYLITTSNHDRSTRLFLGPVLQNRWSSGRGVDPERVQLAQKQFDFYAEELKVANPFSSENDSLAIERARRYLKQFGGIDRVYQFMLAEAGKSSPPRELPPGVSQCRASRGRSHHRAGRVQQRRMGVHAERFQGSEQFLQRGTWVLGDQGATGLDSAAIDQLGIATRTISSPRGAHSSRARVVVRYGSLKDAADD